MSPTVFQISSDIGYLIETIFQVESADALYKCVAEIVPLILSADRVSIALYLEDEQQLLMKALCGEVDSDLANQGGKLLLQKSYAEYEAHVSRQAVWSPQQVLDDRNFFYGEKLVNALDKIGVISVLNVPVRVDKRIIGTLNVSSKDHHYQQTELLQLHQIATFVGNSLQRINNYETELANAKRLKLYAEHLEMLNTLGESLSLASTFDTVLQEIASFAEKLVGACRVSYCVLEPCRSMLRIVGLVGNTTDTTGQRVSLHKSGLSEVLIAGEQLYFTDLKNSPSAAQRSLGESGINHLWSTPIVINGVIKGALNLGSRTIALDATDAKSVLLTLSRLLGSTLQRVEAQAETLTVMKEIERQATTDTLTGLPNRNEFRRRLDLCVQRAADNSEKCGVLFFDLDLFKNINDTLGHAIGDELLFGVARRVEDALRPGDTVARIGGDEFLVLLPNVNSFADIKKIGERIKNSIGTPLKIASRELVVGASIGAVCFPRDGENSDDLIKNADIAMYRAKELGGSCCHFYSDELAEIVNRRVVLESLLRTAIENEELSMVFQPLYDCKTLEPISIEALLRWHHPVEGTIPPDVFIPIAEVCGLINQITDWVLLRSLLVLKKMRVAHPHLRIAVNVSANEFSNQGNLYSRVMAAVERSGLPPQALVLELTETALLSHPEHASELIVKFNRAGIQLAIDDFGTGYASLSYLVQLPIDTIKIDRTFVDDLESTARKQSVVKGIIAIANGLSLSCVGEGVETQAQLSWLTENGCQSVQGYLLSKPVSEDVLHESLVNPGGLKQAA